MIKLLRYIGGVLICGVLYFFVIPHLIAQQTDFLSIIAVSLIGLSIFIVYFIFKPEADWIIEHLIDDYRNANKEKDD